MLLHLFQLFQQFFTEPIHQVLPIRAAPETKPELSRSIDYLEKKKPSQKKNTIKSIAKITLRCRGLGRKEPADDATAQEMHFMVPLIGNRHGMTSGRNTAHRIPTPTMRDK
jgi:hypothetical protein